MITEKDVFRACCGIDNNGESKALSRIELKKFHSDRKEEMVSEITLDGVIVNIFRSMRYTLVDLQYEDNSDYDYVRCVQLLKEFSVAENSMDEKAEYIPAIQVTLMPKEYAGRYFMTGVHGTWCLMPSKVGILPDTIRFIFDNPLLNVYEMNMEEAAGLDEDDEELYTENEVTVYE
ncbi:MAG: hypothetical protein K6B41_15410 [Butyrivibrio sp.]|nr:hypothetical protein [Butyrivibrio sp.]